MTFHFKQIGLALCLVASLLVGSASACTCSHHQEKAKSSETSCHSSDHESAENVEGSVTGDVVDVNCVCFVQPPPSIVSKSESKKQKTDKSVSNSDRVVPDLEFVFTESVHLSPSGFDRDSSYSTVLESLLPARAPPRL
jgi:hypothetical protein